ncbi:cation:proton antiporter [Kocuria marina]|uniref:cation:proton antiporter n=1 Tax=Kocuria marina TaxID=223184 RepID=UPI0011A22B46
MITGLSAVLIVCGVLFFTAGTAALIRFPDIRSQLHALTKADNLGPGLIMVGAAVYLGSWSSAALLAIAWVLILGSASVSAHALTALGPRSTTSLAPLTAPAPPPRWAKWGSARTADEPSAPGTADPRRPAP